MYREATIGDVPGRFSAPGVATVGSIVEAQDNERARLAQELHDGVGQKIAFLQMSLANIAGAVTSTEHREQLKEMQAQVAEIARELHDISHQLHPSRLRLLGLPKSLVALCRESSHQSGIEITFSCDDSAMTGLGPRESLCLYRIAQEAIQNIVKHSHAQRASVQLVRAGGTVGLTVTDFGGGFDDSAPSDGLGLVSMQQRAQLLGGTIDVQTRKNGGTRIRAEIPLSA